MNNNLQQQLRDLPSVSALLDELTAEVLQWGHTAVAATARAELSRVRTALKSQNHACVSHESIALSIRDQLTQTAMSSLVPVFNLTGVVLHSNLGRAQLAEAALQAITTVARDASNLEYDLAAGARGDRDEHIEALICSLTGAQAATVVNNNAAAVLLVLNTLALGKKVPVSRGELVEIGGSFRVPDIMNRSGSALVEVGTTNRTHLKDYAEAIDDQTALIMRVHTSNYRIEGFTHIVPEHALAGLAKEHDIPFVVDMGCGNLINLKAYGLPHEPTVQQTLNDGADLALFSADKLLGGPQAGLIVGRSDLIQSIKRNPLKRALRCDKMTLAALEATLRLYQNPEELTKTLPTLRLLTRSQNDVREQALRLLRPVTEGLGKDYRVAIDDVNSQIGSGSLPVEVIPSAALSIRCASGADEPLRSLFQRLRTLPRPVIGRLSNGTLLLDLRCLELADEHQFLEQIVELRP